MIVQRINDMVVRERKMCPFCANTPIHVIVRPNESYTIAGSTMIEPDAKSFLVCSCGVIMSGDTLENVIEKWNTRISADGDD